MKKKSVCCTLCESHVTDLSICHTIIVNKVERFITGHDTPFVYLLCPDCFKLFCEKFNNLKNEVKKNG